MWDDGTTPVKRFASELVIGIKYMSEGIVEWDHAEPIPRKDRRIMPP